MLFAKNSLLVALLTVAATAAQAETYTDFARVKSSVPEFERINRPRQECYNEVVETRVPAPRPSAGNRDYGGTVLGGIVGGVVGNQFGKGHGREAATAAGAVAGALIGGQYDNRGDSRGSDRDEYEEREVRRCRQVGNWESRVTGYRVTYEYAGRRYTTIVPSDPGRELRLRVSVEPQF